MTKMVVWDQTRPLAQQVQTQLAQHVGNMEFIAEVAKVAMDEVSNIQEYAVFKAMTTMASAELMQKMAAPNGLPPALAEAYQQQLKAYLTQLHQITQSAGGKIVFSIDQLPHEARNNNGFSEFFAHLFGR